MKTPTQLSVTQLRDALAAGEKLVLLDVREPQELALASLPGAVHIPMGDIRYRMDELDPDARTVVMCHHGVRSWHVANFLVERGDFSEVQNLAGGIDAWSLDVDPSVPRY